MNYSTVIIFIFSVVFFSHFCPPLFFFFFFFNDTATTEIYTLSLHDALPIFGRLLLRTLSPSELEQSLFAVVTHFVKALLQDRKSTRLNSSHLVISYAVFCLKKKKKKLK